MQTMNTNVFLRRISQFMDTQHMLSAPENTILCAVSGGADSMCLLDTLLRLGHTVSCAHFNHQLRGEESARDAAFVADYCHKHEIPFYLGHADVTAYAAEHKCGIEEAARTLRYAFLLETQENIYAHVVATAHHADDQLETVLLHMTRGAGLLGLCGIPPVRNTIIRPLLFASRQEIIEYITALEIPYVTDSTNAQDDYTRNKMRHHILPVLKEINPMVSQTVFTMTQLLREDETYLSHAASSFLDHHKKENTLPRAALCALPSPIAYRVIRQMTEASLSAKHVERIFALCASSAVHGTLHLPNTQVCVTYEHLIFHPQSFTPLPTISLQPGMCIQLPGTSLTISCEIVEKKLDIHSSFNIFFFKSDSIYGTIEVRSRRPGDQIRLQARNCTKSIKKLFSEAKIPPSHRDTIPIIADEQGVIAVYGFGVAQRCIPGPSDPMIKIEIGEDNA